MGRERQHSPHPALPPVHGFALLQVVVVWVLGAVVQLSSSSGQALLWSWIAHVFFDRKMLRAQTALLLHVQISPCPDRFVSSPEGALLCEKQIPLAPKASCSRARAWTKAPLSGGQSALCVPTYRAQSSSCLQWSLLVGGASPVPANPVLPKQTLPPAQGSKNSTGSPLHGFGSDPASALSALGDKPCPVQLWGRSLMLAGDTGITCSLPAICEQFVASP